MSDGSFPEQTPPGAVPPPPPPYPGVPQPSPPQPAGFPYPQPPGSPYPPAPPAAPGFEAYPTAPPPGYGYAGGPMPGFAPESSHTSKLAIAALVLGILGLPLFIFLIPGLLALIFGLVSGRGIKRSNGATTGLGLARAGWIMGAISLAGFVTFIALAVAGVIGNQVAVTDLEVGQCVDLDPDDDELSTLPEVDCEEPHTGEVFYVDAIQGFGDSYPGGTDLQLAIGTLCAGDAFSSYVGTDYLDSELDFYSIYPSEELWDDGDRDAVCIIIAADGGDLIGTVRGSNR